MASKFPPEVQASQQEMEGQETLLEFPCRFSVKAMGRSEDGFEALVENVEPNRAVALRIWRNGTANFIAYTPRVEDEG